MVTRNPLWMSRLAEAEAHLKNTLSFLEKQSEYAFSKAELKQLKIEVHDFDFKTGATHAKNPIQSYFRPKSDLRDGSVELTRYNEAYSKWLKLSNSFFFTYPFLHESLLKRFVNDTVSTFRKHERFFRPTAEELETEWQNITDNRGSYTTANMNFPFEVLRALETTKHHHCHRLLYMYSDGPAGYDDTSPPEAKVECNERVKPSDEKTKHIDQDGKDGNDSEDSDGIGKEIWSALNLCGIHRSQPERKHSPSTAELIVLISWILGAMGRQKKLLSSRKKALPASPNLVFPIQVISFKPKARVRILHAYYDGTLRVGISDTQRLDKRSNVSLRQLLRWAWPKAIESTTKPTLTLMSISEAEDEDEECIQEGQGAGESVIEKYIWRQGLETFSHPHPSWLHKVYVNAKWKCLEAHRAKSTKRK